MVRAILEGRKTQTRRVVKPQPPTWAEEVKFVCDQIAFRPQNSGHETKVIKAKFLWQKDRLDHGGWHGGAVCPYGVPGDRLWCREAFEVCDQDGDGECYAFGYKADDCEGRLGEAHWVNAPPEAFGKYGGQEIGRYEPFKRRSFPSIHMPRWASRITLDVVSVRVERLQEISEADAKAEGIYSKCINVPPPIHIETRYVATGVKMVNAADEVDYEAPAHRTAKQAFECLWESINGYGSWAANQWVWVVEFKRLEQP
jgi:hypothetical protein